MEWIFDQQPWIFEAKTGDKCTRLLTWHNSRASNGQFGAVAALLNRKLPEANFSMNVGEKRHEGESTKSSSLFTFREKFNEFIELIKADVKYTGRQQKRRKANTLQLLYEKKIIQNGDRITLLPSDKTSGLPQIETIIQATIVIQNDKPAVKWDFDKKVYSISKLTHIILVEMAQQVELRKHHLNGTRYWRSQKADKSLYAMASTLYKNDSTCH
jgi:hypothetical protein